MNINQSLVNGRNLLYQINQNSYNYSCKIKTKRGTKTVEHNKKELLCKLVHECIREISDAKDCAGTIQANPQKKQQIYYNYTQHRYTSNKKIKPNDRVCREKNFNCHLSDNLIYNCTSIAEKLYKPHKSLTDKQKNEIQSIKQFLEYKLTHIERDLNSPISPFALENEVERIEGYERIDKFFKKILDGELKSTDEKLKNKKKDIVSNDSTKAIFRGDNLVDSDTVVKLNEPELTSLGLSTGLKITNSPIPKLNSNPNKIVKPTSSNTNSIETTPTVGTRKTETVTKLEVTPNNAPSKRKIDRNTETKEMTPLNSKPVKPKQNRWFISWIGGGLTSIKNGIKAFFKMLLWPFGKKSQKAI